MDRRGAQEIDVFTSVVSPSQARLTLMANDSRFYSNAIADPEMCSGRMGGENDTSGFVAEYMVAMYYHGADSAFTPEMNI